MNITLLQAKDQLKVALSRLENIINEKIKALEAENNLLKNEITNLKSKPSRSKKTANENTETVVLDLGSRDEIDDTLNELRKLVGQR
jgi:hypothetical protein